MNQERGRLELARGRGGSTGRESEPFSRRIFMNRETLKPGRVASVYQWRPWPRHATSTLFTTGGNGSFWRFARGRFLLPSFPKYPPFWLSLGRPRSKAFQGRTYSVFHSLPFVRVSRTRALHGLRNGILLAANQRLSLAVFLLFRVDLCAYCFYLFAPLEMERDSFIRPLFLFDLYVHIYLLY